VSRSYDAVVIGGGFYGLSIALSLRRDLGLRRILLLERGDELMGRASYVNQARVHNGYHYPRSILTAYRSRVNYPRFVEDYGDAIVDGWDHFYAISKHLSKVSARQFRLFSERIGAFLAPAPAGVRALFSPYMVEDVFRVREPAFDSRVLRSLLVEEIESIGGIDVHLSEEVTRIEHRSDNSVGVETTKSEYVGRTVISAVYARINHLHRESGIPELPLQHEVTEMALVRVPDAVRDAGFTVMDGPFFSMMPFPSRTLHTLSHVRYTPLHRWHDATQSAPLDPYAVLDRLEGPSKFENMRADVLRFMPGLGSLEFVDRLVDVKTVLTKSSADDSRPILFRPHHGIRNYTVIMGGKLDNIYDVLDELRLIYV
jgi:glycine/D-amino acid oxidase-like deaminating enzyme